MGADKFYAYTPYAFETVTISSANGVSSLTETVYNEEGQQPPSRALVTVGTGPVISYVLTSTVTVSSQTGHQMVPYAFIYLEGHDQIRNFRTTSVSSGTTATVKVTYFR